ncbi:MAG: hypothetical protein IJA81_00220 [Akkermansia sp.]|nr:hypothetical protein [Akkermansia sp.]
MITKNTPTFRAPYSNTLAATPHLHEGKMGKLNAAGEIELATSDADAFGVISDPDSYATAQAGNATGATIVHRKFAGVVQAQLNGSAAAVVPGTKLVLASDGTFTTGTGTAVAEAVGSAAATTAGQLVDVILL